MRARPLHLALLLLALGASTARAQRTVINLPSADQTAKGEFFALHESNFRAWGDDGYYATTNFLTYGISARVEAAFTVYNLGAPVADNRALGVGYKASLPVQHLAPVIPDFTLTFGQMGIVGLDGGGGLWTYGHLSGRVPGLGTRIAAGASAGPEVLFGAEDKAHFIAFVEHPLPAHFFLVAEWFSGEHAYGDLVPGITWRHGGVVAVLGYKISNAPGSSTDGMVVEVGTTFRLWH
ncbi:MAG TPA: hypothetical protein VFY20_02525 [Gemmatimonadales bacterium]|nr:hypothetical protein [Gemmatimonadales bacterium]